MQIVPKERSLVEAEKPPCDGISLASWRSRKSGDVLNERPASSRRNMGQCFSWRLRAGKPRCPSSIVRQEEFPATLSFLVFLPVHHLIRCDPPRTGGQRALLILPIPMLISCRHILTDHWEPRLTKYRSTLPPSPLIPQIKYRHNRPKKGSPWWNFMCIKKTNKLTGELLKPNKKNLC